MRRMHASLRACLQLAVSAAEPGTVMRLAQPAALGTCANSSCCNRALLHSARSSILPSSQCSIPAPPAPLPLPLPLQPHQQHGGVERAQQTVCHATRRKRTLAKAVDDEVRMPPLNDDGDILKARQRIAPHIMSTLPGLTSARLSDSVWSRKCIATGRACWRMSQNARLRRCWRRWIRVACWDCR